MAQKYYCFYGICSIYILFYFSCFIAFLVCVVILKDSEECHHLKNFGIAQMIMDVILGLSIFILNTTKLSKFLIMWFVITLSFFIAGLVSRGTGLCHQPLDNLLWVYLFINLILCGILIVFAILWSCWRILKQCCCSSPTSTPRIRPSSPTRTKTKWVLTWLPVWVEVD